MAKKDGLCAKLTWPCRIVGWRFLELIGMDAVYTAQTSEESIDFGRPDI